MGVVPKSLLDGNSLSEYKSFSVENALIETFYSSNKNIGDFRPIGYGKTTEANDLSVHLAIQNQKVLRIMPNYLICEENAKKLESMIFKGRTQPGMCEIFENFPQVFDLVAGRYLCKYCRKRKCEYKKQYEKLRKTSIVFTVKENLPLLLKKFNPDVVIIDDVPISCVIHHTEDFELEAIKTAKAIHIDDVKVVFDYLLTDRFDDAIRFVRSNAELIMDEIKWVEKTIVEIIKEEGKMEPKLKGYLRILSDLYNACIKDRDPMLFSYKQGKRFFIRLCWSDWSLRGFRVIYQDATPTEIEKKTFAELGDYEILSKSAEPNEKWRVIQLTGAMNPLITTRTSERFVRISKQIIELTAKLFNFVKNEKMAIFAPRKVFDERLCSLKEDYSFIYKIGHYERISKSSNSIRDYLYSCVFGILHKPPLFYYQKPYITSLNRVSHEIGDFVDISMYPVVKEISLEETAALIKQELGRIFRGDKNTMKVAVVFSSINLDEGGIIPEIGAIVEKYGTRGEKWIKRLRELLKMTFADVVIKRCGEVIVEMLKEKPRLKVEDLAEYFTERTGGIYNKTWFKRRLTSDEFLRRFGLKITKVKEGKTRVLYVEKR